jgi:uncharacterized membrane protein
MSEVPLIALIAVYSNRAYADAAVAHFLDTMKTDPLNVAGIAVVEKDLDDRVTADEVSKVGVRRGMTRGAVVGAVVGIICQPGILIATATGTVIGGAIDHRGNASVSHRRLESIGTQLYRGHSGVVVIVNDAESSDAAGRLLGYKQFHRVPLDFKSQEFETAIQASHESDDLPPSSASRP